MLKIKINKRILNGKSKYKLSRATGGIVALALTAGVLSSCVPLDECTSDYSYINYDDSSNYNDITNNESSFVVDQYYQGENNNYTDTNNNSKENNFQEFKPIALSENYLTQPIIFSDADISYFQSYVNNITVHYPYEELYNIDNVLNKYYKAQPYKSNYENIFTDNLITEEQLFSIVKNNSKELKEDSQLSDSELKKVCSYICEVLNDYLKNNDNIDYSWLSEKVSKLKVKKFCDFESGYYDHKENLLGINFETVEPSQLKKIIQHEVYHLIQNNHNENNSDLEHQFGFCSKYKTEKVNSLNLCWFYEGGAEALTMNINNTMETDLYTALIDSMNMVKIATTLHPNNELSGLENTSLSADINDLFKYFNCVDEENKKEILKMMFAFEFDLDLNFTSPARELKEQYRNVNWYDFNLKYEIRCSIAQTLSKQFYSNLIVCSKTDLKDAFELISIFENVINKYMWQITDKNQANHFFETYNDIQGTFFQLFANKLGLSVDDIMSGYNYFYSNTEVNGNNIANLSTEKQQFYNYIVSNNKYYKANTVNELSANDEKWRGR